MPTFKQCSKVTVSPLELTSKEALLVQHHVTPATSKEQSSFNLKEPVLKTPACELVAATISNSNAYTMRDELTPTSLYKEEVLSKITKKSQVNEGQRRD